MLEYRESNAEFAIGAGKGSAHNSLPMPPTLNEAAHDDAHRFACALGETARSLGEDRRKAHGNEIR